MTPVLTPSPLVVSYCCLRTGRPDGKWPGPQAGLRQDLLTLQGERGAAGGRGGAGSSRGTAGVSRGCPVVDSVMEMFSTSGKAESKVQGVVLAQCESRAQQCWHSLFAGGTKKMLKKRFMLLERAPLLSSTGKLLRNQTAFKESQTLQATATVQAPGYEGWSDVTRPNRTPPAPAPEDIPEGNIMRVFFDIKTSGFFSGYNMVRLMTSSGGKRVTVIRDCRFPTSEGN